MSGGASSNTESLKIDLEDYRVEGTSSVYYIPNFVSEDEEEYLIRQVGKFAEICHLSGMRKQCRLLTRVEID